MSTLVIVESPTKARTIRKFLPNDYRVEASMGHVRDLPSSADEIPEAVKKEAWAQLGVNVDAGFEPIYVIPKDKRKIVKELKDALKNADELVLATDEDREGESISWHLRELLKPKVPIKRMVFHEITREAIQKALQNCRDLNEDLVHAQETRRILDRLVGYTLSPLLWKKIATGLSAGRVQSVAVRLLVQRERERRAFISANYWDLKATLEQEKIAFEAKLVALAGQKVATGDDFEPNTGQVIAGRKVVVLNEASANELKERLEGKLWTVVEVKERQTKRKPSPPFTTSTLQQEANRKLGLGAKETMRIAQGLYEQGYITYMRTDSVHLSAEAIAAARSCIETLYGKSYLSPQPRQYQTKSKGAQEAHEAIRPAGSTFRLPKETGLGGRDFSVYDLIWKRTVASQMAEAQLTQTTVRLEVEDAEFRSSGQRINFPGFFRVYVEGSDDPAAALDNRESILPALAQGDHPECKAIEALSHDTQPPARYTEASLVKVLESEGIGRPSTYASIMGTIVSRGYVQVRQKALIPTFTAFAVTSLLENHFQELVDPHFTARMEQSLDEVAAGKVQALPYLEAFYRGEKGLATKVKAGEEQIDPNESRQIRLADIEAQIRVGRYGAYLETEADGNVVRATIPEELTPADLSPEQIETLLRQKTEGPDLVGLHPETGEPILIMVGRYGHYIQLGEKSEENKKPKRASLPKGTNSEDLTVEMAVGLLSLPRLLGEHPATGKPVKASFGPFGPYVVHEQGKDDSGKQVKDYRSLKAGDDVLSVTLDRALELLAQPKQSRGGSRSAKKPLRELGAHPEDGEPVNLYDGRYGPYVQHGKVNASLPEGETVESVSLETALKAIAEKASTKKTSRSTKSKSATSASDETGGSTAKASKSTTSKSKTSKSSTAKSKTSKSATSKSKTSKSSTAKSKTSKSSTRESETETETETETP